jgi:ABC-type transporter Mla maintaining outer membrane lipid asymmetry ATPase subunit MlaF
MNADAPILILDDVRLSRTDGRVSLEIRSPEIVVLAGASGSEKSELLLTAAGFHRAREGSVRLFGVELSRRRASDNQSLRRKTGFVFQTPVFIHNLTSIRNIALPLEYDDVLETDGLHRRIGSVLDLAGLSTNVDAFADDLPPLDCRRLALARAWIREPEIVFYDEPARGLDPAGQKKIYQAIHAYHEHRKKQDRPAAALLSCNDPRWVLEFADRYLLLNAGILTSVADATNIRSRRDSLEREFLDAVGLS